MELEAILATTLAIPFTASFKHASAERSKTQSLWVEARSRAGLTGFGEGCPREYVSAEDLSSALAFVGAHRSDWIQRIHDLESLRHWMAGHGADIDANPAAWAAVELAVLDLLGKEQRCSVDALLGLAEISGRFTYTAVLGDSEPQRFRAQMQRYQALGLANYKIKLCGDLVRDRGKVRALTEAGISADLVRADANNLWRDVSEASIYINALDYRFSALEEPLAAGDYAGLRELGRHLDTAIILDESLLREAQLHYLGKPGLRWIINVRVSKMGGLLRALGIMRTIREFGFGMIIGAQVGETSVLTRAALTVANNTRDILLAQEGAFGTHLLSADVTASPLMFGAQGQLDSGAFGLAGKSGLGLSIFREGSP
jgi:L-alanine-DL-glutamate epimerase-like enolase superfamily enzyme